jgi:protein arginine kinase
MSKWYLNPGPENDVVISTRIRLSRNLADVPFPVRMSVSDRRRIIDEIKKAVYNENGTLMSIFQFVDMEELSKMQAVSLVERQLVSADFVSERIGRCLFVTDDESSSIMVNEEDHYVLQAFSSGLNLDETFHSVDRLETILNKTLHFAFDSKLGYLTQNPVNLGTGMNASVFLHLPALTDSGATARLASNLSKLGLSLRGAYGSVAKPRGAVYQLSNNVTLGLTEQEALANLNSMVLQIVAQERSAREKLVRNMGVKDTIWRSMGVLRSARLLTNDEFSDLISIVRFGISAGEIPDLSLNEITSLMFRTQPATLTEQCGKMLTAEERHVLRADMVRRALSQESDG